MQQARKSASGKIFVFLSGQYYRNFNKLALWNMLLVTYRGVVMFSVCDNVLIQDLSLM